MTKSDLSRRSFIKTAAAASLLSSPALFVQSCRPKNYFTYIEPAWSQRFDFTADSKIKQILEIVRFAILAPSSHNTQPWIFAVEQDKVTIMPDFTRKLPIADPDSRELFISLGCAVENFVIAAEAAGFNSEVILFPGGTKDDGISIQLAEAKKSDISASFKAITLRHTNRNEYYSQAILTEDLKALEKTILQKGINALFIPDKAKFNKILPLIAEANKIQMENGAYMRELMSWIRFSDDSAVETLDGLSSRAMGIPPSPDWIAKFFMKVFSGHSSQTKEDTEKIKSSSSLFILSSEKDDREAWVETGRSFERLALSLTTFKIKNALHNQPVQVKSQRKKLNKEFSLGSSFPQMIARIGYAPDLPHSLRRPVEMCLKKI